MPRNATPIEAANDDAKNRQNGSAGALAHGSLAIAAKTHR